MLDTMAKTDSSNPSCSAQCPTVDGHRVDIIQMNYIGATALHFLAHFDQDGNGSQRAHDPADTQRVGDGLAETVFLWDLKIGECPGSVATNLNHVNSVVGAIQCAALIRGRFNCRTDTKSLSDPVGDNLGGLQALCIIIKETKVRVG